MKQLIVNNSCWASTKCSFVDESGEIEIPEEQPSSHRLAKSMGVDARNMQVMKASFFANDEAPAGLGM